jgi:hypothetical protein
MTITRANLRTAIRTKLKNFALARTTLAGNITSSVTTFDLASATELKARVLLEVGTEVMRVHSSSTVTVSEAMRGEFDSTAAAHSTGDAVKVYPLWGWTDLEINAVIDKGIVWLGEGMVYVMTPKTNTYLAGFKDFGLPAGVVYPNGDKVKIVKSADSAGTMWPRLDWHHEGDRLVFNNILPEDTDVELWIETAQPAMTSDSSQLSSDKWLECLQLYCAGRLQEEFIANRALFYEFSATLHDRASSMDELERGAYFMTNQATILRDALSRPGIPGFASKRKDA